MRAGILISLGLWAAILALVVLFTGCAELSAVKSGIATHGASAADDALEAAEWGVCKAPTMGAWQRRYGSLPDKADGWRRLCGSSVTVP